MTEIAQYPAAGTTGPREPLTAVERRVLWLSAGMIHHPSGQHIELGIAETNLVGMLGELGATRSRWGQTLFPIGLLYDPFVSRALEPWTFGLGSARCSTRRSPRWQRARRSGTHWPRRSTWRTWASASFGQTGDLQEVYRYHGIAAAGIAAAALQLLDR